MDLQLFEKLLAERDIAQALNLLTEYLGQPLTQVEEGAIYTAFALAYMKVKTEYNKEYLQQLKKISEQFKLLNKFEKQIDEAIKLADLRKTIK